MLLKSCFSGPLGFQIASDAFAYVYVSGLMMALNIIEEDMNDGLDLLERWFDADERRRMVGTVDEEDGANVGHSSMRQLRAVSSTPLSSTQHLPRDLHGPPPVGIMPEPLFCDPLYCSIPHPPNCLNYEKPVSVVGQMLLLLPHYCSHVLPKLSLCDSRMERPLDRLVLHLKNNRSGQSPSMIINGITWCKLFFGQIASVANYYGRFLPKYRFLLLSHEKRQSGHCHHKSQT